MTLAKVFVQGRAFNGITAEIFENAGKYQIVKDIKECDIAVWTGGEDINPAIYGEKPIYGTYFTDRDKSDIEAVHYATDHSKFMVGICRGAQLLNCLPNGGKLWQDVDNHGSCVHTCFDCITGEQVKLNSVHHQMMIPTGKAQLLAWASESTVRHSETSMWKAPETRFEKDQDPEAVWYSDTRSLLAQFHPEFNHRESNLYFFGLMDKFYWRK